MASAPPQSEGRRTRGSTSTAARLITDMPRAITTISKAAPGRRLSGRAASPWWNAHRPRASRAIAAAVLARRVAAAPCSGMPTGRRVAPGTLPGAGAEEVEKTPAGTRRSPADDPGVKEEGTEGTRRETERAEGGKTAAPGACSSRGVMEQCFPAAAVPAAFPPLVAACGDGVAGRSVARATPPDSIRSLRSCAPLRTPLLAAWDRIMATRALPLFLLLQ